MLYSQDKAQADAAYMAAKQSLDESNQRLVAAQQKELLTAGKLIGLIGSYAQANEKLAVALTQCAADKMLELADGLNKESKESPHVPSITYARKDSDSPLQGAIVGRDSPSSLAKSARNSMTMSVSKDSHTLLLKGKALLHHNQAAPAASSCNSQNGLALG